MRKDELDDLDDMIAELESSLGVNTSEYLDDYLDTVGLDDDDDVEMDEIGDEFEEEFGEADFEDFDAEPEPAEKSGNDFDDDDFSDKD